MEIELAIFMIDKLTTAYAAIRTYRARHLGTVTLGRESCVVLSLIASGPVPSRRFMIC